MIFGNPKWPPTGILWKKKSAIESDFRSSKITADHFVKNFKKLKLCWSEMVRNAIESDFQSSKMSTRLLVWWKPFIDMLVLIWNGDKCDRKWFSVIQNDCLWPFCKNKFKLNSRIDLKWREIWFDHPEKIRTWYSVI